LRDRVKKNRGRVYPGGPEFTLLIDLKTDWHAIYPVLRQVLNNYTDVLTTFDALLDDFLQKLPKSYAYAVEFRHPSWIDEEIFDLLRKHDVAHVSLSSMAMPMNLTVTSDLVYIRFHGLKGGAAHDYTRRELEPWANHIRKQSRHRKTVFAYFNNDVNIRAPKNAKMLMDMVGSSAVQALAEAA